MLRRAENVYVSHKANVFTGHGWLMLTVGKSTYRVIKIHKNVFTGMLTDQLRKPVKVGRIGERAYWWHESKYYWDNEGLDREGVYALLVTKQQRAQSRVDRAKAIVASGAQVPISRRGSIPDDLKQLIWTRDKGRCQKCGSNTELQFDHIIPVSLGGGTAAENLQILCGPCNRRKGSGITS